MQLLNLHNSRLLYLVVCFGLFGVFYGIIHKYPREKRLPTRAGGLDQWVHEQLRTGSHSYHKRNRVFHHSEIQEFSSFLQSNPVERMLIHNMIEEAKEPRTHQFQGLDSTEDLLILLDHVMKSIPEYRDDKMIGCPFNAILDRCMNTTSGYSALRNANINDYMKRILSGWAGFLNSPSSWPPNNTWMQPIPRQKLRMEEYVHDPDDSRWGFDSWNEFFTRKLINGTRPVNTDNKAIASSCDSHPFQQPKFDVKFQDNFWLKGQDYSLRDMFDDVGIAREFVGDSVYQAFLSPLDYHRWHSPISGTIRIAKIIPGLYFSQSEEHSDESDVVDVIDRSQSYLAHIATRAAIIIDADDPCIGSVGFLSVGMVEVSSNIITVNEGQHVNKGEELGYFQFGGSTYCLVFQEGVIERYEKFTINEPQGFTYVAQGQTIAYVNACENSISDSEEL